MRRAWAWFSGGVVDLSAPKGVNRPYAFSNIPVIVKIVLRNIISAKRWVLGDMETIRNKLEEKTVIVKNVTEGLREIDTFVSRSEKEGAKLNLLN
ncbi:MAG: hypothetical protein JRH06_15490 [Deltaproteobacteria bacterium]|nr:hypothetical protein [Deltaproteobacteria bacterium]